MSRLEQSIARRDRGDALDARDDAAGALPEPVALISMLGEALHAAGKNHIPNPRIHRGAVAMAQYFHLKRVAARLDYEEFSKNALSPG
jgi:hypothetical protein